eukprot:TRINITY_DN202_c0_g1_i11.p1 TRINITY_DN202_c0_g1~~TRINITY_DN202_c0_g1_i11.p1  ORF type:complete len:194 (-),score=58.44 TRINITY_DN202_c0_g1_i11:216-797(-)
MAEVEETSSGFQLGLDEDLKLTVENTIFVKDEENLGSGTLQVTTRRIYWQSAPNPTVSFSFGFREISLHAKTRDVEIWPQPCIYCQLETEDMGDETEVKELRLIPGDEPTLEQLYVVMTGCAELNPDPVAEDEGDSDLFFDPANIVNLADANGLEEDDEDVEDEDDEDDSQFEDPEENGLEESDQKRSKTDDQ